MITTPFSGNHFRNNESPRNTKTVQEKQIDSFKMYQAVERLGDKYPHIVKLSPKFQESFIIFKRKTATILEILKQQESEKKNQEAKRLAEKSKLCKAGADIAGLILINMKTVNSISLKPEVNALHAELMRTKEESLAARIQDIHDAGVSSIKVLTSYGITPSLLQAFQQMITDYFKPVYPKELALQEMERSRQYRVLFREVDIFLKDHLDKNISTLRKKNPQFVHAYKDLRVIKTGKI